MFHRARNEINLVGLNKYEEERLLKINTLKPFFYKVNRSQLERLNDETP